MTRATTTSTSESPRPFVLHTRVVTGTGGGPEKTILNSPRFLRQFGIDSACAFIHPKDDPEFALIAERGSRAGAEVLSVPDRRAVDLSTVKSLIRICRERNVRIWHGHDYKSNALGLLVRMFHPMHLVTTAHGWVQYLGRLPLYYRLDRFCMKRFDQVICVSDDLEDRCRDDGIPEGRLSRIENAILLDDYSADPPSLADRARFGFGSQHLLIGAAGRLSEEKGFHHLIFAVSRLVRDGHPVGLVIAGDGPLAKQLQQQVVDLDLQGHVHLAGYLPDPRVLYRAIDLFVLSSVREGLPNVVLEAMASRRAVVATGCNGIPALIHDNCNGLVVRPDSASALYDGMARCVVSDALRERLADAGRRTVAERYCFEQRMRKVVDVYRRLSDDVSSRIRVPCGHPPVEPLALADLHTASLA